MKEKLVNVKNYHLEGNDVRITFSMENPSELELVYEYKQDERKFTGRAIYREETLLGFMPSVVLEETPDQHRTTLSLAVPSANRPDNAKSIPLKTFAVKTTGLTSISGPETVEGQIQSYEIFTLEGNAW